MGFISDIYNITHVKPILLLKEQLKLACSDGWRTGVYGGKFVDEDTTIETMQKNGFRDYVVTNNGNIIYNPKPFLKRDILPIHKIV